MTLRDICDKILVDPSLQPQRDANGLITHCNQGARIVAQALGCMEFDDMNLTAEGMINKMEINSSGRWISVTGSGASAYAITGGLAFAFMSAERLGDIHAHIAPVYPASMGFSGSLGRLVPFVANVGKQNKEELVSSAFPVNKGEPEYRCYLKGE